jgi:hypothetical protein
MAKKVNLTKLAFVSRVHAEITNRRRAPEAALYLMQLQLPRFKISPLKRKLTVIMDASTGDGVSQPVKIRHLA